MSQNTLQRTLTQVNPNDCSVSSTLLTSQHCPLSLVCKSQTLFSIKPGEQNPQPAPILVQTHPHTSGAYRLQTLFTHIWGVQTPDPAHTHPGRTDSRPCSHTSRAYRLQTLLTHIPGVQTPDHAHTHPGRTDSRPCPPRLWRTVAEPIRREIEFISFKRYSCAFLLNCFPIRDWDTENQERPHISVNKGSLLGAARVVPARLRASPLESLLKRKGIFDQRRATFISLDGRMDRWMSSSSPSPPPKSAG